MPDSAFIHNVLILVFILSILAAISLILFYLTFKSKKKIYNKNTDLSPKPDQKNIFFTHISDPVQKKKKGINYCLIGKEIATRDPAVAASVIKKWLAEK